MDLTGFRSMTFCGVAIMLSSENETEECTFACTILSHDGNLGSAAHIERNFLENGFVGAVLERHILKTHDGVTGEGFGRRN